MKFNKQTVLTVASIAGVAASIAVTAVMAPKAEKAIKAKLGSKSDKLEVVKTAAPYYIPTAVLGLLTIGSILLNHHVNRKALLGLSATTSYLVANRDQLRKFIDENPKVKKIAEDAKEYFLPPKNACETIEETGNGDLLCFEAYTGRIFRSSEDAVIKAEDKLIEQYLDEEDGGEFGYASYNDLYYYLRIRQTQFGHEYGWANNEDYFERNEPIGFHNELIAKDAPGNQFDEPVYLIMLEDGWQPMWGYDQV